MGAEHAAQGGYGKDLPVDLRPIHGEGTRRGGRRSRILQFALRPERQSPPTSSIAISQSLYIHCMGRARPGGSPLITGKKPGKSAILCGLSLVQTLNSHGVLANFVNPGAYLLRELTGNSLPASSEFFRGNTA